MAINRMISITPDLDLKLKKEENASALITRLLNNHYAVETAGSIAEKKQALKQLEETKKQEILDLQKDFENQKEILNNNIQEENFKEIVKKELEENKKTTAEQFKENVKFNFKEETNREMTEDEYATFKELWDNNLTGGIYDFIETLNKN